MSPNRCKGCPRSIHTAAGAVGPLRRLPRHRQGQRRLPDGDLEISALQGRPARRRPTTRLTRRQCLRDKETVDWFFHGLGLSYEVISSWDACSSRPLHSPDQTD